MDKLDRICLKRTIFSKFIFLHIFIVTIFLFLCICTQGRLCILSQWKIEERFFDAGDKITVVEDYGGVMEIIKKSETVSPPSEFTETVMARISPLRPPVTVSKNKSLKDLTKSIINSSYSRVKEIRKKKASAAMRGFTMIEFIVVLLVIGLLSAFAMSRYSSTATYSLKTQTEVIKNHLRYAQTRAMNSNDYWGINFAGSSYTFFCSANPSSPVLLPGEDSSTVTIPAGITTTVGVVVFDTWGKPYIDAAGTSIQTGNRNITVSLTGEPSETITITENTGFVP